MKSFCWMRPDSWNSVSVVAAVMAIIPFKGNDVPIVESVAIGLDDQVNADPKCWPPTRNGSNLVAFLYYSLLLMDLHFCLSAQLPIFYFQLTTVIRKKTLLVALVAGSLWHTKESIPESLVRSRNKKGLLGVEVEQI